MNPALLLVLASVVGTACASGGGGSDTGGGRGVITREQIAPLIDRNAFDLIQQLRPSWLRTRDQGSPGDAAGFACDPNFPTCVGAQGRADMTEPAYARVFLDELHMGDVSVLESISATQIERIEYMTALDATTLYGTGFTGGLIIVRTIGRTR